MVLRSIHRMICHDVRRVTPAPSLGSPCAASPRRLRSGVLPMKELFPLSGVVAIPQTPFDDHDRIDLGSFARGVADRLAAGVDGLLYPVVASEVSHLTAERAARRSPGRSSTRPPRRCRSSSGRARTMPGPPGPSRSSRSTHGAAGVLVQAPVALLRDEAATIAYFRTVCEAPIEMLMIQDLEWNGPGPARRDDRAPVRGAGAVPLHQGRDGAGRQQVQRDPRGDRRPAQRLGRAGPSRSSSRRSIGASTP